MFTNKHSYTHKVDGPTKVDHVRGHLCGSAFGTLKGNPASTSSMYY